jgi:hypothetical protein
MDDTFRIALLGIAGFALLVLAVCVLWEALRARKRVTTRAYDEIQYFRNTTSNED